MTIGTWNLSSGSPAELGILIGSWGLETGRLSYGILPRPMVCKLNGLMTGCRFQIQKS